MRLLTVSLVVLAAGLGGPAAPAGADWLPDDGHKMHQPQMPDPNGWDVQTAAVPADDWQCSATGPVSEVHFWMSWREDRPGEIDLIQVEIYDNDDTSPVGRPGTFRWRGHFGPGEFSVVHAGTGNQGWFNPNVPESVVEDDHNDYYQVNIEDIQAVTEPFTQEEGNIYWLQISVPHTGGAPGWKTSQDDFLAGAVYWDSAAGTRQPLVDPLTGGRLGLAFVITPEPGSVAMLLGGGLMGLAAWWWRRRGRR